jgi:hypothetical protein
MESHRFKRLKVRTPCCPCAPDSPSAAARITGATDLFASFNVTMGNVIGTYKGRHRSKEFRAILDQVEASVPADLDVHLSQQCLKP